MRSSFMGEVESAGSISPLGVFNEVKAQSAFFHYCETDPQARGKGIYPAVLSKIVSDLKGQGEVLMSINAKNMASVKGAEKAGFVERESKSAGDIGYEIYPKTGLRVLIVTQGVSRIVKPLFHSSHQIVGVLESASRNYKKQKTFIQRS